ncbi:uncharacterized transmembrane protein DDB_G0289901-like [Wyeomyia smithii]|uniref:uncharacterized transmembrane protein DDB_G0289901-like n=1 Tax=Wyeomyia smithii TaxID=174621 RepID=UPI002467F7D1|nr:uncharacterized transmembrane protein DDB_G0289901-like [Wyeomyia smithii]
MRHRNFIGLIAIIGFANALPNGFQSSAYPQNQLNAWDQACRSFQQFSLQSQAAQSQYFSQHFPSIGLPPLPFVDVCSQFNGVAGGAGFSQAGAGAAAGSSGSATGNRFGGGGGGGAGVFQGVSVSTGSFPGGGHSGFATNNRFGGSDGGGFQGVSVSSNNLPGTGTVVSQFGPGGSTVTHYPNGGGFATANRFGGSNGNYGGATFSSFGGFPGGSGGFASTSRFGGNGANAFGSVPSNGGSFASATRFGDDGANVYTAQGPHGAGVSVSSTNDGRGNVRTQVNKHQY